MFQLETKRLRLIPLNLENLLLLKENRALMEKNLQLTISQMVMEERILAEIAEALAYRPSSTGSVHKTRLLSAHYYLIFLTY